MSRRSPSAPALQWDCQPKAWALVRSLVDDLADRNRAIADWRRRLLEGTGTRLIDWIDHLSLDTGRISDRDLANCDFERQSEADIWSNPKGLFPLIRRPSAELSGGANGVALKVESVDAFALKHGLPDSACIWGDAETSLRMAEVELQPDASLWVTERHGNPAFLPDSAGVVRGSAADALQLFLQRPRLGVPEAQGFAAACQIFDRVRESMGRDPACDLLFAAERSYWQSRNRAARVQRGRQDELGLGWANHDHHTYRSSREHFARLIGTLEHAGFVCRERFYAGAESGWGAQVLEQPNCGLVVFADVDLSADEVAGDFAHDGLASRDELGTVGFWCRLHGESFLQAGMHHLECQFDFDAVRQQLNEAGIETMAPFTDFAFLRQAFTAGERWTIDDGRIQSLLKDGLITAEQAEVFRQSGAIGSHLEILERNEGYKGFNQTGVSDIIRRTDPRQN